MDNFIKRMPSKWKETIFQVLLHIIVFIFYSISRKNPQIEEFEVVFFLNPALMAFVTNYLLLPRLFYPKKYLLFAISLLIILTVSIGLDELVLEQIYFPTTRGTSFPGVFYTLLGILPVATILVGFKFAWDAFRKQREVEALKEVVRESELQFLKSQINPHFLFNNLNNLYAHAIAESPKTPEIILELSSVLRYMLYDCKEKLVPLSREIEQLKNYIGISELQIEERGEVQFHAPEASQNFQIAPLILVVFVENAFKHSTASQSDNIFIEVKIDVDEAGTLTFSCVNTFHAQSNVDNLSHGIGLANVRKRLDLLYPGAYSLDVQQKQNLYQVDLSLELNQIV